MRRPPLSLLLIAASCAEPASEPDTDATEQGLSASVKRARLELIRDAAAEMGVYNAALFGGIAMSETALAHCWSEAPYACMGPASSSCGGEPIIAGSADGPCRDEQGGLGMFQFDAGTYAQTLATYGSSVLTVEGNTAQAVAFVVDKVILEIDGVTDWRSAVAWINQVPLRAGHPVMQRWARLLACRYNGCCAGSTLCTTRANRYRDHALELHAAYGAEFWRTAARCRAIPAGGIIEPRSACYVAGGDPRHWRRDEAGHGGEREWTSSTAARASRNFGQWLVRPARAGTYRIEVHVTGGAAKAATYEIAHAGGVDRIDVDQSAADGWVVLGELAFAAAAGGPEQYVLLADNTGTPDQKLVFDALRVTALDTAGDGSDDDGCATSAPAGGVAVAGLVLVVLGLWRRRHRTAA